VKNGKFKIFTAMILVCFTLCASILSGCSLVTTDYAEYYKAIVASATTENGKKIEITKKDLLTAYSSFGYQYSSYYGMSQEEAVKMTLEQLVSNELIIDKVERKLKSMNDGKVLKTEEKTYLWEKTYDALIKNLEEVDAKEDEKDEDEEKTSLKKEKYEKKATYSTQKHTITKSEEVKTEIEKYTFWSDGNKDASTKAGREEIYKMLGDYVVSNPDYSKAYSKYLSNLRKNEEGQKLSTVNKDIFLREIERLYEVNYESYLMTRYEEIYKNAETNVTSDDILDLYKSYLLEDYATYAIEESAKYNEDILNSAEGMYYIPEGEEFFYVTHILIKFDEDETKDLEYYNKVINGEGDGKITIGQAKTEKELLYTNLKALVRTEKDGEYVEDKNLSKKEYSAERVLSEIQSEIAGLSGYKKAEKFNDLMFKFTEDSESTLNATYNYVIGVDYSTPEKDEDGKVKKDYTAYTQMVETFTDAAIELYDHGNGQIGDISGLVRSEFGYHILMYAGKIENFATNISLNMNMGYDVLARLDETRVNAFKDYTYFDMLYENLEKDDFSTFQTQDINLMKSKLKEYKFFKNAYKDMI